MNYNAFPPQVTFDDYSEPSAQWKLQDLWCLISIKKKKKKRIYFAVGTEEVWEWFLWDLTPQYIEFFALTLYGQYKVSLSHQTLPKLYITDL